jgi:hypothetical protein
MIFNVPRAGGNVRHFEVTPVAPVDGVVQAWPVKETGIDNPAAVDSFNIAFSASSTQSERQSEAMTLVFTIASEVQTDEQIWRFSDCGAIYCNDHGDYLADISFALSANNTVLTMTVSCLTNIEEDFSFVFVASCRSATSGEIVTYSSTDPGGSVRRNN